MQVTWGFAVTPPYQGGDPALVFEHQNPVRRLLLFALGSGEGVRTRVRQPADGRVSAVGGIVPACPRVPWPPPIFDMLTVR